MVVGAAMDEAEDLEGVGGGKEGVEPLAGMRDEADVELEDVADAGEVPVSGGEEGVLEAGELSGREVANACVVVVREERVAI